jgi:Ser/Thr protein kinase RdoA (MazF antagonist)
MARIIRRKTKDLEKKTPVWGFIHGDVLPTNVRCTGDPPRASWYDFEFCGMGWRAWDVASWRCFQLLAGWKGYSATQSWKAFQRGYGSVRSLEQREKEAIPALIAARLIMITGLHAWLADIRGHFVYGVRILKKRLALLDGILPKQ